MSQIVVQKFGGTSVQTLDRMRHVARIVKRTLQHKKVIVVVSAMAGETDRLLELGANFIVNSSNMCARELDSLVSTGEQVSASLLSLALQEIGVPAKSFLSHQVKIVTSDEFNSARIQQIEFKNLLECLNNGIVPVVAGFQGIDQEGNITTLGRGGSDTTAVALAGALKAIFPEVTCEIFTDVEGVYTLDPRIEPDSKLLELISYDEMLELASSGAKVLHPRCVALAAKYKVPLLVKSTFNDHSGSLVSDHSIEDMPVTGISVKLQQSLFNMRLNSFDELLAVFKVFSNAVLDVISLISDEGGFYLGVTVGGSEMNGIKHILESRFSRHFELFHPVAVVTLVGIGMMHQRGIALHVLRSLNESSIDILAISTSEIKISCVVKEHEAVLASRVLHQSFGLGQ